MRRFLSGLAAVSTIVALLFGGPIGAVGAQDVVVRPVAVADASVAEPGGAFRVGAVTFGSAPVAVAVSVFAGQGCAGVPAAVMSGSVTGSGDGMWLGSVTVPDGVDWVSAAASLSDGLSGECVDLVAVHGPVPVTIPVSSVPSVSAPVSSVAVGTGVLAGVADAAGPRVLTVAVTSPSSVPSSVVPSTVVPVTAGGDVAGAAVGGSRPLVSGSVGVGSPGLADTGVAVDVVGRWVMVGVGFVLAGAGFVGLAYRKRRVQ